MEIKTRSENIVLRLGFKEMGLEGKEKFSSKSFRNIKEEAEDLALYETGLVLAGLQTKDLEKISRQETVVLEEL